MRWKHNDWTLSRDVFPRRQCSCNTCTPTTSVPARANTNPWEPSACFVAEDSQSLAEFTDMYKGAYGSACWNADPALAVRCLTPGDPVSHAFARPASHSSSYASPVLFLVGDSHATALIAAFGSALVGENAQLAFAMMDSGGGFQANWPNPATPGCGRTCNRITEIHYESAAPTWVASVTAGLEAQLRPGDVLALTTAEWKLPHQTYIDAQEAFLRSVAAMTQRRGATLLLVGDVPYLQERGQNCLTPGTLGNCATNRSVAIWYHWPVHRRLSNALELHQSIDAMHARIAADFGSSVVYLPTSWMFDRLCTATTCGANVPGTNTLAFIDQNHLSTAGSLYLGPHLNCYLHDQGLI